MCKPIYPAGHAFHGAFFARIGVHEMLWVYNHNLQVAFRHAGSQRNPRFSLLLSKALFFVSSLCAPST